MLHIIASFEYPVLREYSVHCHLYFVHRRLFTLILLPFLLDCNKKHPPHYQRYFLLRNNSSNNTEAAKLTSKAGRFSRVQPLVFSFFSKFGRSTHAPGPCSGPTQTPTFYYAYYYSYYSVRYGVQRAISTYFHRRGVLRVWIQWQGGW